MEQAEVAVHEAIQADNGVKRLGLMSAVRSLNRNLRTEDRQYADDVETHQRDLWGRNMSHHNPGDDDMDIMAARDVSFHYGNGNDKKAGLAKAAIIAAAIGAPLSIAAWQLPKLLEPDVTDTDTRNTLRPDDTP